MRKTSVRRFIHAILDVLPLLIIPIFAININQKSVEPISIEVQEKISVDFNQLNQNSKPNNLDYYRPYNSNYSTLVYEDESLSLTTIYQGNVATYLYGLNCITPSDDLVFANHIIVMRFNIYSENHQTYTAFCGQDTENFTITLNEYNFISLMFTPVGNNSRLIAPNNTNSNINFKISYWQYFDLTKMYGSGNEPTLNQFNIEFPNVYYPFTESQKMLIDKPTPTTYDDTDIGSQFLYSLYKPVQDYFNFNNLFNMGQIYDWIQLNLFSGTAPLPIFIIWNIIVYEFFIDLIFLMYSLFMFIIDWSTNMIDKFLYKSRS